VSCSCCTKCCCSDVSNAAACSSQTTADRQTIQLLNQQLVGSSQLHLPVHASHTLSLLLNSATLRRWHSTLMRKGLQTRRMYTHTYEVAQQ
jgi:hypothetical protein